MQIEKSEMIETERWNHETKKAKWLKWKDETESSKKNYRMKKWNKDIVKSERIGMKISKADDKKLR